MTTLQELKDTFNGQIGLNAKALFDELDRLAAKLGIKEGQPLTDAFLKAGRSLYEAYISQVAGNIVDVGWKELVELYKSGRVPKREKRVGASTA